jgi:hypothetical protein
MVLGGGHEWVGTEQGEPRTGPRTGVLVVRAQGGDAAALERLVER